MAMLERAPSNATVTAVVPSQVVEVPGAAIEKLLNNPAAALAMVRTVRAASFDRTGSAASQHMKLLGETTALLLTTSTTRLRRRDAPPPIWIRRCRAGGGGGAARTRRGHLPGAGVRSLGCGGVGAATQRAAHPGLAGEGFPLAIGAVGLARRWRITLADLDGVESTVPAERLHVVVTALAADVEVGLAAELALTAERVSEVVGAVRRYAHEGRALIPTTRSTAVWRTRCSSSVASRPYRGRAHVRSRTSKDRASAASSTRCGPTSSPTRLTPWRGPTLTLRTRAADGEVTVEVIDSGPGIPDEVQPHVFDDFFTTKQLDKGTGLGLLSVKAIVVEHHGTVDFTTRPGSTTFRIVLPTAQPG